MRENIPITAMHDGPLEITQCLTSEAGNLLMMFRKRRLCFRIAGSPDVTMPGHSAGSWSLC